MRRVVIIGGGAAGFFAAINLANGNPNLDVVIVEKSNKLLGKVKISGGGRCNVTHYCFENNLLLKNYPRGNKELNNVFHQFSVKDTIAWFEERGVELHDEADGRMFPETDNSQTIIDCFMTEASKHGVKILLQHDVEKIEVIGAKFELQFEAKKMLCDYVVITTGGHPKLDNYDFIQKLGHTIEKPIPSLFTFNLPNNPICKLMGVSLKEAQIKIVGTKLNYIGPLLITHWGLSGPAVLKLSAFAAEYFNEKNYQLKFSVNWCGTINEEELKKDLLKFQEYNFKSKSINAIYNALPKRLWEFLLNEADIEMDKIWGEVSKKCLNKLIQLLRNHEFEMNGKTTFKEEFVTCGGVNLKEVNLKTMESKLIPNLFFAGEVLNIDGITGGFNFQACWSTGYVAASSITAKTKLT